MSSSEELIVCKFGGSSVADADHFRKIKKIVESDARRKVIVVSAPGKRSSDEIKLTDLFYTAYDLAVKGIDFSSVFVPIRERYLEIASELGVKADGLRKSLDQLEEKLKENASLISEDYLVSRGENFSALLMADWLDADFVDSEELFEIDHNGRVSESLYDSIAQNLQGRSRVVVPGFYGRSSDGGIRTFSRGGSDITGSILAAALAASQYENWTDVSGLLMTDPRIVNNPKPMSRVSYREIRELAYMGANVFHDEAIAPCRDKGIVIRIKNTNRPDDEGTMIAPPIEDQSRIVTGIAGRKNFAMIHLEKNMMNKEKGFGRKVLGILEEHGISYEHSPTGIDSMSIVVDQTLLEKNRETVLEELQKQLSPDNVRIVRDVALVATVGHGMSRKIGVASRLFTALAKEKVNVRIIDQGSSEMNIITGVDAVDFEKAIQAIYSEFDQNEKL